MNRDELLKEVQNALDEGRDPDARVLDAVSNDSDLRMLLEELLAVDDILPEVLEIETPPCPDDLRDRVMERMHAEPDPRRVLSEWRVLATAAAVFLVIAGGILFLNESKDNVVRSAPPVPASKNAIVKVQMPRPSMQISGKLLAPKHAVERNGRATVQSAGNFLAGVGRLIPNLPDEADREVGRAKS